LPFQQPLLDSHSLVAYFFAVSMTEILDELPKLSVEERQLLFLRLSELGVGEIEETPEMLAAIDEAQASPHDQDLSVEEMRQNVIRWARTKHAFSPNGAA
jgi:hypothetical protein